MFSANSASLKSCISGHYWHIAAPKERDVLTVVQKYSLPVLLAQILVNRGIYSDQVGEFLTPSLKQQLPDPSSLKDMDTAVAHVTDALKRGLKIAILGDYDVDGATSSALLYRFFKDIDAAVPLVYIPDRLKEGYGPSVKAIDYLLGQGIKLLITVDCGTTAFSPLSYAKQQGMTVIVIDHHVPESTIPSVDACINPNRLDETSSLGSLAAVGLCFLFIVALNRAMRLMGWYNGQYSEPNLFQYLDLVALGTVCDVVSLTGLNRAYIYQGLKILAKRQNLGIRCLMDVSAIQQSITPYHLGYLIGPRINAGSRMAESSNGFELLTTQDPAKANSLAIYLNDLNLQRRHVEQLALEEALAQAYTKEKDPVIVVWGHWAIGIIGIVAGRLKDVFKKPCFVISLEQPVGKGSARSIANVDIGSAIHQAKHRRLIEEGGGHAMAGGFSIVPENIPEFCCFINEKLALSIAENPHFLFIEGIINPSALTIDFVRSLEKLGPFGAGNPQPRFMLKNMRVAKVDIVKENHLRCLIASEDQKFVQAMAFQCVNTPLGNCLLSHQGRLMHLAGTLNLNIWNGKESVSFNIQDIS